MVGEYFISAVGDFQNECLEFDFGFHTFGPHSACCFTNLQEKYMLSPQPPPLQYPPPNNWSWAVASQGTLSGCSHWLLRQYRLALLITKHKWHPPLYCHPNPMVPIDTGEEIIYTPPHSYSSFYHSYLSMFLYPLTQFILFLTLYLSPLSITISPLTHLIYYYISSPLLYYYLPNINVYLLGCRRLRCGIVRGRWGFDYGNIYNSHENNSRAYLTLILFFVRSCPWWTMRITGYGLSLYW